MPHRMKTVDLTIDGHNLTFHLGLGFLGELLEETSLTIENLMEKIETNPYKYIALTMFRSAEYHFIRENKPCPFNRYEFADMMERDGGITTERANQFFLAFTKSLTKDVPVEQVVEQKAHTKKK